MFRLYLGLLVVALVFFGAVHAYAYSVVFLGVLAGGLVLVVRSVQMNVKSGERELVLPWNGALGLLLGMAAWMVLQVVPLPQGMLEWISPQALTVGKMALPAAEVVASEGEVGGWLPLAPYGYPVRMSLVRWVVYGVFFLGVLRLLDSRKRMETLLMLLLVVGCLESVYGIFEAFSGQVEVLWSRRPTPGPSVSGTFINRNHFAAFAGAVFILAAAGVGAVTLRKERVIQAGRSRLRSRLARALGGEQGQSKRAFMLVTGGVTGLGLVLSGSRGAILAGGLGLLALGAMLAARRGFRRRGLVILVLCGVVGVYALQTGVAYTEARFRQLDMGFEQRLRVTQAVMEIADEFPWAGVGVGNFQYAFPRYQPEGKVLGYYRFGHNDWAQLLAEAGLVGAVIVVVGLGWFLFRLLGRWKRRHLPFAVCVGAGGVAVLLALGLHGLGEFHLHIPAVFLVLCAVLALAYAALHLERRRGGEHVVQGEVRLSWKGWGRWLALVVAGVVVLNGVWVFRHVVAEAYCSTVPNSTLNRDPSPGVEEVRKAISWDGGNAAYWFKLALGLMGEREQAVRDVDDARVEVLQGEIIDALEGAVRRNPMDAQYHLRLGWEYTHLWKREDYHERWLPAADLSMERAAYFAGDRNDLHMEMGHYWTMRSKTIYPSEQAHHAAWARARWHFGEVLERKRFRDRVREIVWLYYPDETYVREALGE